MPNPKFLYPSSQHEEALARLLYAVESRKGCALLTGEHGCGKTMVSRALIGRLDRAKYDLAWLVNPTWTVVEFLRETLYQCGVETAASGKPELLRRLNEVLLTSFRAGRSTIVVIDEAQLIEDPAVLEEVRLLLNFQTNDRFLMTLLLIGSVELDQRLRRIPHLDQRISVRAHIDPLSREETAGYIAHRLRVAGGRDETFTPAAIARIFEASGGRPRMINNLCDFSLLTGCVRRLSQVDEDTIAASLVEIEQSDGTRTRAGEVEKRR